MIFALIGGSDSNSPSGIRVYRALNECSVEEYITPHEASNDFIVVATFLLGVFFWIFYIYNLINASITVHTKLEILNLALVLKTQFKQMIKYCV
jgi:hypothetical protein